MCMHRYGENVSEKSNKTETDKHVSALNSPMPLTNRQRNATLTGIYTSLYTNVHSNDSVLERDLLPSYLHKY